MGCAGVSRVVEAIYENGVLKPLEKLDLREGQRVRIEIIEERDVEVLLRRYRGCLGKASYEELRRLEEEVQFQP